MRRKKTTGPRTQLPSRHKKPREGKKPFERGERGAVHPKQHRGWAMQSKQVWHHTTKCTTESPYTPWTI